MPFFARHSRRAEKRAPNAPRGPLAPLAPPAPAVLVAAFADALVLVVELDPHAASTTLASTAAAMTAMKWRLFLFL
jgi:hypothetical protein